LLGAVEIRIGDGYRDLIDGHEPLAAVLERHDAWWISESLDLAKQLRARDKRPPAPVDADRGHRYRFRERRASARVRIVFWLSAAAIVIAGIVAVYLANRKT